MTQLNKLDAIKLWVAAKAASPHAEWWLAGFSFSDASFSPVIPDPLLAVMSYFKPEKWQRVALITTAASVFGAYFGYWLGTYYGVEIVNFLATTYGLEEAILQVEIKFRAHAFLALFTAAFTPIPFKVFTVSAGIASVNLWLFGLAAIIGRGMRFYLVSWIAAKFGSKGLKVFNRTLLIATLIFVAIFILFLL